MPDNGVNYDLKLNGQIIGMVGQKVFSNLTQTTDFLLSASTENEELYCEGWGPGGRLSASGRRRSMPS